MMAGWGAGIGVWNTERNERVMMKGGENDLKAE